MSILDFKEIPQANKSSGLQDTFELFCRDFLKYMGYKIILNPNRGQDGGLDILVKEIRKGVGGETTVKWLVSCKHKAHSGQSVTVSDEQDITDRITAKNCQGFIGFYSTLPSSSLSTKLEEISRLTGKEVQIFDWAKIEQLLLSSKEGIDICRRYFPISIKRWNAKAVRLLDNKWKHGQAHMEFRNLPLDWWTTIKETPHKTSIMLSRSIIDPYLGSEITMLLIGEKSSISHLASLRPFNLDIISGAMNTKHGPLWIYLFLLGGSTRLIIPEFVNPFDMLELGLWRDLSRQSHWHLFLIDENYDQVGFFEFKNIYKLDISLNAALDIIEDMDEGNFLAAIKEVTNDYTPNDLYKLFQNEL